MVNRGFKNLTVFGARLLRTIRFDTDDFVVRSISFTVRCFRQRSGLPSLPGFSRPRFRLHLFFAHLFPQSPSFPSSFSFLVFPMRRSAEKAAASRDDAILSAFLFGSRASLSLSPSFQSFLAPQPPEEERKEKPFPGNNESF